MRASRYADALLSHRPGWKWAGVTLAAVSLAFGFPFLQEGTPPESVNAIQEIDRGPIGAHRIAVTFDAGGEADGFILLVAGLKAAHIHGTFFVTGCWAQKHPEFIAQLVQDGHEIGNHTRDHPDMTQLGFEQIRQEIRRTEALLVQLSGHQPLRYWRAPYGARNRRVLQAVGSLRYTSIYWTLDSLDSVGAHKTPQFLHDRILDRSEAELDGAILLFHVGEVTTAQAMPEILRALQARKFQLVTISELLAPRQIALASENSTSLQP